MLVGILISMAFILGCNRPGNQDKQPAGTSSNDTQVTKGEGVIVDLATQQKGGISVQTLKTSRQQNELMAYGTVLGLQGLLKMRNDYASAEANLEKARTKLDVSQKQYERAKSLNADGKNISDKELQAAQAAWETDKIDLRASEDALQALEDAARQQWGDVVAGWIFDDSPEIDRLVGQKDRLIQISLPPDAGISEPPRAAWVATADENRIPARLVSLSPQADTRIQGTSLFYLVTVEKKGLQPGTNITAYLPSGPEVSGIVVPSSAIVWWQGSAWVYVQKETEHFVRLKVSTADPVEGGYFVTEELKDGDSVVVAGAQLLLSEEFRSEFQSQEKD